MEYGFYNMDCMQGMKEFPDKFFDLAIVDPPYGIGIWSMTFTKNGGRYDSRDRKAKKTLFKRTDNWDFRPGKEYFEELFRVSKNQIIWGGNYFIDFLYPSKSYVVWDKRLGEEMNNDFADCEIAWCSNGLGVARVFRYLWNGMLQGNMKYKEKRVHPTQKPVALYEWLLSNYAKPGYKILDTHVGSASSLIACENMGFQYVGFEIDTYYFDIATKRIAAERAQQNFLKEIEL